MIDNIIAVWPYVAVAVLLGIIATILATKALKSSAATKAEASVKSMAAHVKDAVESHLHKPEPAPAAPVGPVTTPSADKVAAKHAALDKRIADGQAAQTEKDALTAAQAVLDKLAQ